MDELLAIKKQLFTKCAEYAQKRLDTVKEAIDTLKEAADEETKNVTGDKYETGRAMLQLEMENYSKQLAEARKLKEQMDRITPNSICYSIESGCLAFTDQGTYYVAISVGKITLDGKDYFAVAPSSPIGEKMLSKKAGDEVELNGRKFKITKVY